MRSSARLAANERALGSSGNLKSIHIGHSSFCHNHSPWACFISTPPPTTVPASTLQPAAASALSWTKSTVPASASYTGSCISWCVLARPVTSDWVLPEIAAQ